MQSLDGLSLGLTPQPSHSTGTWKQEELPGYQLTEGWKGFPGGVGKYTKSKRSNIKKTRISEGKYELINLRRAKEDA